MELLIALLIILAIIYVILPVAVRKVLDVIFIIVFIIAIISAIVYLRENYTLKERLYIYGIIISVIIIAIGTVLAYQFLYETFIYNKYFG